MPSFKVGICYAFKETQEEETEDSLSHSLRLTLGPACSLDNESSTGGALCRLEYCNAVFTLVISTMSERVNVNVVLFSYTRAFGDGPRNFEPWSSGVDDT
ncbi:hypothetical protein TNCV_2208821 [Trichonephila clavipes]|nr:hypothetical protein TNCV_2208821 [Trichonephila clavipes]